MKVFFDHQTFSHQLYGGVSRYFCELITGINNNTQHQAHLSLLWSNNIHLKEYKLSKLRYPFPDKHRLLHTSNRIFNTVDCKVGQYDIYHATYFDDFLSNLIGSKPLITTFYDMTYERLSHRFSNLSSDKLITEQKKKIVLKSSHLIAISESTKQDMVEILGIKPERITVIHLGSPFLNDSLIKTPIHNHHERPYLLYVGNRSGYKNFDFFLKAASSVLIRYKIMILCAGGGAFNSSELNLINSLSLTDFIEQVDINDEVLPNLYQKAIAFVFPTIYEGFGIPILEAFSCNCPCVISNTSSLPEVAGNAALYFDPSSEDSIVDALEHVVIDDTLRADLVQRGIDRLSLFSWKFTVAKTIDLYEQFV